MNIVLTSSRNHILVAPKYHTFKTKLIKQFWDTITTHIEFKNTTFLILETIYFYIVS